ncbi:MAG: hypothetical protein IJU76_02625 [Desulfovibrionaceae bacterium]|nr:hypothetical protein [Desulfovibrionaceae bacterium]
MAVKKEKTDSSPSENEATKAQPAATKKRVRSTGTASAKKTEALTEPRPDEEYDMFDEVARPIYPGPGGPVGQGGTGPQGYAETQPHNTLLYPEEPGFFEKLCRNKLRILEVLVFILALAVSGKYLLGIVWHPDTSMQHGTFIEPASPPQFPMELAEGGVNKNGEPAENSEQVRQDLVEIGGMLLDIDKRVSALEADVKKLENNSSSGEKKAQGRQEPAREKTSREKAQTNAAQRLGKMADWRILGFSGTRVVIQTPNGSHFLRVGQVLDGVKIVSINAADGIIETSDGALRCNAR